MRPGKEQRIELRRGQEAFQAQGLVPYRAQLIEFLGLGDDMATGLARLCFSKATRRCR
jgi:hypothetical protein